MEEQKLFSGSITRLERAMDLRNLRHQVITSNIANMDTPNYKAFDVMVAEEMAKQETGDGGMALRRTHSAHLPIPGGSGGDEVSLKEVEGDPLSLRRDNNTVDLDREMTNLSENGLMYNAVAQILSRRFNGILSAIQGGTR